MKTFAKYAIWLILFWILSDILIYFGINSTYKDIERRNEISSQISVNAAEATTVNGRIIGTVTNSEDNDISDKYLKIDLYAESISTISAFSIYYHVYFTCICSLCSFIKLRQYGKMVWSK